MSRVCFTSFRVGINWDKKCNEYQYHLPDGNVSKYLGIIVELANTLPFKTTLCGVL